MRRFLSIVLIALALPASSFASQLIDRNAADVQLSVSKDGMALLSYKAGGVSKQVVAWGALDARQPSTSTPQVKLKLDYSGRTWAKRTNACKGYDGPGLDWFVAGCRAPDGSWWAVQSWQCPLPDLGFAPWLPTQSVQELRLSHWRGPLAKLELYTDWVYGGRFQELFGRLTYDGLPVHGFKSTSTGGPLDTYGRNIYLDTLGSTYGTGWWRENSFLAHNPSGDFCYGFYPFKVAQYAHPAGATGERGPGVGTQYRATVIGPGVTPDVMETIAGLHPYDAKSPADVAYEEQQNTLHDQLSAGSKLCQQH